MTNLGFIGIEEVEETEPELPKDYSIRTVNPYATGGPGDGRTWNQYFKDVRAGDEEEREKVAETRVTIPGHSIAVSELPTNIRKVAELIHGVKARHSQTYHEGEVFKTGDRKGEKRPDKLINHYAIGYYDHSLRISGSWSDAFNYGAVEFHGMYRYTEKVTEFKRYLKGFFND